MADKILRTKIALLYKTLSEWEAIQNTYKPLKGEVCICEVPESSEIKERAFLLKVGDGENFFGALPWISANAADVSDWAKEDSLLFKDLSPEFLAELQQYITEQSGGLSYRIIDNGDNTWQLQQKGKEDPDWVDASGLIDINAALNKKVDREVKQGTTTSLIFNEADGGGAQITTATNKGFAGVHDGTNPDETYATMYVKNANGTQTLVRLDLNADGTAHYLKGNGTTASEDNELATKGDIKDLESALKFIGSTNRQVDSEGVPTETPEEAIARLLEEKGHTPVAGDVVIIDTAEYVYDGEVWKVIGDEGTYATKAALEEEVDRATAAEDALDARVGSLEENIPINSEGRIANLNPIAYDGLVNHLEQNEGEYLILDCNA